MVKLIVIKCPNCGARVKYNRKDSVIYCSYCQTEILVEDDDKNSNTELKIIKNCHEMAQNFFKNAEYEEASKKYDRILELNINDYEATFKRGLCITLATNYLNFEIGSCVNSFKKAIDIIRVDELDYEEKTLIINEYAQELLKTIIFLKNFAISFYVEHNLNKDEVSDYLDRLFACLKSLEYLYTCYELVIVTKTKIGEAIIDLIEEIIKPKKYYLDYYDDNGNLITNVYAINRKTKKQLVKKKKQYLNDLCQNNVEFKNKYKKTKRNSIINRVLLVLIIILLLFSVFIVISIII